jgi:Mn2+/Fe2+ NRAMP family transporter
MVKTKKKIYLPKWQRFFTLPIIFAVWGLITYVEFFDPNSTDKMGTVGYILTSVILFSVTLMLWLMTSGRLPSYIIEEEKTSLPKQKD